MLHYLLSMANHFGFCSLEFASHLGVKSFISSLHADLYTSLPLNSADCKPLEHDSFHFSRQPTTSRKWWVSTNSCCYNNGVNMFEPYLLTRNNSTNTIQWQHINVWLGRLILPGHFTKQLDLPLASKPLWHVAYSATNLRNRSENKQDYRLYSGSILVFFISNPTFSK